MSTEPSKNSMLERVRTIADFQFGRGAGEALFPESCTFRLSTTKRIRYVLEEGERIATVRAQDGRLTLSPGGALRVMKALEPPAYRVTVLDEVAEFIAAGKNAMAKHVVAADPGIRAGDEVFVTASGDRLLATGSAVLCGEEMLAFNYGVAVKVRKGSD